jgi:hypothetical protein
MFSHLVQGTDRDTYKLGVVPWQEAAKPLCDMRTGAFRSVLQLRSQVMFVSKSRSPQDDSYPLPKLVGHGPRIELSVIAKNGHADALCMASASGV